MTTDPVTADQASGDRVITDHGARAGADCTDALRAAIAACAGSGGRVVVPAGVFRTGAVRLADNVELHLADGATLAFDPDPSAYPLVRTRWQGVECYSRSSLVHAHDAVNVAITGTGVLDGGASPDTWWRDTRPVRQWQRLLAMVEAGTPVEERVFDFRPSFVQPYGCRDVRIEGVRIVGAPMWAVHPVLCTNVVVRGVTVVSRGPNNDGCNPDSCDGVLITGCTFDTGDDCIAIKSGRDADGRRVGVPCRDVVVEDCTFAGGHGAVTIGSEVSGGVHGVRASGLRVGPHVWHVLRVKTNSHRGGVIEDIRLTDSTADVERSAVVVDLRHADHNLTGSHHPKVADITVAGLRVGTAPSLLQVNNSPVRPVTGLNVDIT